MKSTIASGEQAALVSRSVASSACHRDKSRLNSPARWARKASGEGGDWITIRLAGADGRRGLGDARNRLRRMERSGQDDAHRPAHSGIEPHLRSRGTNSWRKATQETEICGQRLWVRRAEKGRLNVPNPPQRPVLRSQATEMSGYFSTWEVTSVCADYLVGRAGLEPATRPL